MTETFGRGSVILCSGKTYPYYQSSNLRMLLPLFKLTVAL